MVIFIGVENGKENNMDELVKKGLQFGLGVTYITAKALNQAMVKMEKEGKIDRKDGEKLVKETIGKYQKEGNAYAKDVRTKLNKLVKVAPFASKKDIAEINAQIEKINKLVKKYSK